LLLCFALFYGLRHHALNHSSAAAQLTMPGDTTELMLHYTPPALPQPSHHSKHGCRTTLSKH